MELKRGLAIFFLLAAVSAPVANEPQSQNRDNNSKATIGHVGFQERGPSFSSPEVTMHENGDRVSHYPPYYHPEHSGNR